MRSTIGTATRARIDFALDIEPDIRAGASVQDMLHQVARDRISMAYELLTVGHSLIRSARRTQEESFSRSAVSRYYYAMFQAARGVVYISHRGDDKEAHNLLPSHLPNDLPSKLDRANDLKSARSLRNDADYDPYSSTVGWLDEAQALRAVARSFVADLDSYLISKGI